MSSPENQFKIRPAYQLMLIFILLGFGLGLYLNWKDTGSLIGHGFSVEYIESIEQDIKTEYEKTKGVKVIKVAMIKIHKKMAGMRSRMVLQVHDELVFDAHKDELDTLKKIVTDGMEKAVKIKVSVVIELGEGANWLEAK